jgi:hypothetical protein
MAGVACHAARVLRGYDLRKPFRLSLIGLMADRAQDRCVGELWNNRGGIFGVLGERAMAGFAVNIGVLSLAFQIGLVGMAGFAGLVACEFYLARADVVHSAGTEVAVLAEFGGDDHSPYYQEGDQCEHQQKQDPDQMFAIPEEVLHGSQACNRPSQHEDLSRMRANAVEEVGNKTPGALALRPAYAWIGGN